MTGLASDWIGAHSPAAPDLECSDHNELMVTST